MNKIGYYISNNDILFKGIETEQFIYNDINKIDNKENVWIIDLNDCNVIEINDGFYTKDAIDPIKIIDKYIL